MKCALLLLAALALGGCGSMAVNVDVLNPEVVDEAINRRLLSEALPTVLSQTEGDLRQRFNELQNEHFGFYVQLSAAYADEAARLGTTRDGQALAFLADTLQPDFSSEISPHYEATIRRILELNWQIERLAGDEPCLTLGQIEYPCPARTIVNLLKTRDATLRSFFQQVSLDIESQLDEASFGLSRAVVFNLASSARTAAETARKSLIGNQGLVEDPHAWAVASAAEDSWSKRFDSVVAKGRMGNVNIAVKMNKLGEFTLKGLTFDPGDVARVASKVTSQSLLLAAQISGVPVTTQTTSGSTTPGTALASSSRRLQKEHEDQLRRDTQLTDQRRALQAIAEAVLREWGGLDSSDGDARKRAIAAVKESYAAQKPRLQLTATSARVAPAPQAPAPQPPADDSGTTPPAEPVPPEGGETPPPEQPADPEAGQPKKPQSPQEPPKEPAEPEPTIEDPQPTEDGAAAAPGGGAAKR